MVVPARRYQSKTKKKKNCSISIKYLLVLTYFKI